MLQKLDSTIRGTNGQAVTGDQVDNALKTAGLETFYLVQKGDGSTTAPANADGWINATGNDVPSSVNYRVYKYSFNKAIFDALPAAQRQINDQQGWGGHLVFTESGPVTTSAYQQGSYNFGSLFETNK